MITPRHLAAAVGGSTLAIADEVGGMVLVLGRTLGRLWPPRPDRDETRRALASFGVDSLPVVVATAAFVGAITVLQSALYVRRYGVYDYVGWYTGFVTFREVGPLLVGLMFSGRVGASNTSELATMAVTEQLDALRILALDVYELLILPRTLAMIVGLTALCAYADLVAVCAGALAARTLVGVELSQFARSLVEHLAPEDFLTGLGKSAVFGAIIAIVSSHFGLRARGGSAAVGRAVNAQVVACAIALFVADYFLTSVIR
jgi:phospholipid/cholesterol/gamma-HCH transport system permease protein